MIVILMGVSGSGKTTIGELLAQHAGIVFADADDYHSAANKQKMAAGHALTDEDRQPWFETLHSLLKGWFDSGTGGVLACSALKEKYRAALMDGIPPAIIRLVSLELSKEQIAERLKKRHHEFMNPALLDSQFATLEVPENALHVLNDRTPEEVVQEIMTSLHLSNEKRT
ncbi:gluconokinase [Granulicella arctica]|uniref:gluconokinase n=1 Tax=Granulicella arctica TaxID=940613 RepID=UPI0021E01A72|nr:gluconokinase [Granulicella arctica]